MKGLIVYVGSFSFPDGDAVAKRAHGLMQAFSGAGYATAVVDEDPLVASGEVVAKPFSAGIAHYSLHKPHSNLQRFAFRKDFAALKGLLGRLKEGYTLKAVIFCGTRCALFANAMVNFCKKNGIVAIADSMDWLSARTGSVIFDMIKQSDTTLELRYVNKKANGVIAISTYLANFYRKRGKKTIVVPPLSPYTDRETRELRSADEDIPKLVYAGIPCRLDCPLRDPADAKDRVDIAIALLYRAYKVGVSFCFHIYGMSEEQYTTAFPEQKTLLSELREAERVRFYGKVSADVVKQAVSEADFTILLREKNRTAMAGYPTKISESITLGTPVITTDTSDISSHIKDGVDGFFLDIADLERAYHRLMYALTLNAEQRCQLKENANHNVSYSPSAYSDRLADFIRTLCK